MVYSNDAMQKYGVPSPQNPCMTLWKIPSTYVDMNTKIPYRIWCNKDLVVPLSNAFKNLLERGLIGEIKSWNGCFNIRSIRGSKAMSLHSWGIAFDINAAENALGAVPKLSKEFVDAVCDAGFDWGGNFTRKDGMHFQLSKI
jgi:hypothetical protein